MGLFDKKYCDICGKEIKFLGNKKLDDGNMCKDCAAKLSPWFSGRRHTAVADIKRQLDYRAANEAEVKTLYPTEIYGKRYKVYLDNNNKKFTVSNSNDWRKVNPDVFKYSDVWNLDVIVNEEAEEEFDENEEGKEVSFDPPKFKYEYRFDVKMNVRNEFFDEINFELSYGDRPDSPESDLYNEYVEAAKALCKTLGHKEFKDDRKEFEYYKHQDQDAEPAKQEEYWYCIKCGTKNEGGNFCRACGTAKPIADVTRYCPQCGEKITDQSTKFCPKCGHKL